MIRVEVSSTEVQERNVKFNRRGQEQSFHAREQFAYAYLIQPNGQQEPHPAKIAINLEEGQAPFDPGAYVLAPESLYVNRYGKLELGRLRLRKMAEVGKAKAA